MHPSVLEFQSTKNTKSQGTQRERERDSQMSRKSDKGVVKQVNDNIQTNGECEHKVNRGKHRARGEHMVIGGVYYTPPQILKESSGRTP